MTEYLTTWFNPSMRKVDGMTSKNCVVVGPSGNQGCVDLRIHLDRHVVSAALTFDEAQKVAQALTAAIRPLTIEPSAGPAEVAP